MDKRHQDALKRLAKKALHTYRWARGRGYAPALARIHAHMTMLHLSGGRTNLFAAWLIRRYKLRAQAYQQAQRIKAHLTKLQGQTA